MEGRPGQGRDAGRLRRRADDAQWLGTLAGAAVRITIPRYRMWEGRGYRNGCDPLTAGLSHLDLFWKRYQWNGSTIEDPSAVIEQLQDASVAVDPSTG